MILATGWTLDELRAAPARLVRALMWRIFAARAWDREYATFARQPAEHYRRGTDMAAWSESQRASMAARKWLTAVESALWPEDDDG